MDELLADPWLNRLTSVVVVGSTMAWVYLIARRLRVGEFLAWEPRHLVPWGAPAGILALALSVMTVATAFESVGPGAANAQPPTAREITLRIASMTASQLLLSVGFFLMISRFYNANRYDFGLPRSSVEALRDLGVGTVTCLAALLPVRIVQGILLWLLDRQDAMSQHPLIETLTSHGSTETAVLLVACVSTVVVAPICEEVTYRLLLQGWLERWEHVATRLGQSSAVDPLSTAAPSTVDTPAVDTLAVEPVDTRFTTDAVFTGPSEECQSDCREDNVLAPRGAFGLPYGWVPILTSSLLFGIAHFGYGPEPVPLFFFGVMLGYVYQRTHRIVPCIVAHALFNLASMLALWRIVVLSAEHVVP